MGDDEVVKTYPMRPGDVMFSGNFRLVASIGVKKLRSGRGMEAASTRDIKWNTTIGWNIALKFEECFGSATKSPRGMMVEVFCT